AGVLGRLLAWRLARAGHTVSVFDPAAGPQPPAVGQIGSTARPESFDNTAQALRQAQGERGPSHAAGFTAAGMLSPIAELDNADATIARLGWRSLPRWRAIGEALAGKALGGDEPLVRVNDSLLLAH